MVRPKLSNLMSLVRLAVSSGEYRDTYHSSQRTSERLITRLEVEYVLMNGWHEKNKDYFDDGYESWNYAIRGLTLDKRELRIIVTFDEDGLLIITAIDLSI